MTKLLTHIWTARGLVIAGFVLGHTPISSTFNHIGDERFSGHTWYHFFREGVGDLAAMTAVLVILFIAPRMRNPAMWWLMLISLLGMLAPFWIGMPFNPALAAPACPPRSHT